MSATSMSVLVLAGFATLCLCAPAPTPTGTFKEPSSNKVIVEDDEYLTQDERERIVAGLILQIARDFDEGYITQDELEGRSSVRQDDVSSSRKSKDVPEENSKSETSSLKT